MSRLYIGTSKKQIIITADFCWRFARPLLVVACVFILDYLIRGFKSEEIWMFGMGLTYAFVDALIKGRLDNRASERVSLSEIYVKLHQISYYMMLSLRGSPTYSLDYKMRVGDLLSLCWHYEAQTGDKEFSRLFKAWILSEDSLPYIVPSFPNELDPKWRLFKSSLEGFSWYMATKLEDLGEGKMENIEFKLYPSMDAYIRAQPDAAKSIVDQLAPQQLVLFPYTIIQRGTDKIQSP